MLAMEEFSSIFWLKATFTGFLSTTPLTYYRSYSYLQWFDIWIYSAFNNRKRKSSWFTETWLENSWNHIRRIYFLAGFRILEPLCVFASFNVVFNKDEQRSRLLSFQGSSSIYTLFVLTTLFRQTDYSQVANKRVDPNKWVEGNTFENQING